MSVIERVARLIPDHDLVRVGIDGPDASGKTTFADSLARALERPAVRVSLDDFHNERKIRYRLGRESSEGFWLHAFNYERFREYVVDPLTHGRSYRPKAHDLATDAILDPPPMTAPANAVLIVDGLFLLRDELEWDFTVFLDVPFTETARRMAERDGITDPRRYVEAQRIYFARCTPHERATILIDNTDCTAPRIVRSP